MKKIFVLLVVGFAILLAACGSGSDDEGSSNGGESSEGGGKLAELQEKGSVTIGFANEKPYAYEENGEIKGAAVDIAIAVFKELGIEKVES
ncbi:MAG TPA: ectoine/hydroxyectoine ABC transporter substrate-binding protein EhuB, partial [Bacillota bacterium]|nr:ectoine/hydroxyectoine ABC transporter substrate-binding protein EhuB [Bacillota bacterium]